MFFGDKVSWWLVVDVHLPAHQRGSCAIIFYDCYCNVNHTSLDKIVCVFMCVCLTLTKLLPPTIVVKGNRPSPVTGARQLFAEVQIS